MIVPEKWLIGLFPTLCVHWGLGTDTLHTYWESKPGRNSSSAAVERARLVEHLSCKHGDLSVIPWTQIKLSKGVQTYNSSVGEGTGRSLGPLASQPDPLSEFWVQWEILFQRKSGQCLKNNIWTSGLRADVPMKPSNERWCSVALCFSCSQDEHPWPWLQSMGFLCPFPPVGYTGIGAGWACLSLVVITAGTDLGLLIILATRFFQKKKTWLLLYWATGTGTPHLPVCFSGCFPCFIHTWSTTLLSQNSQA